jgi:hypothetical protein
VQKYKISAISAISAGPKTNKTRLNFMKLSNSTWKQLLQILATIITTIAGTLAVQSCAPHWF